MRKICCYFLFFLFLFFAKFGFSQYYKFKYIKPIIGQEQQWHSITLPADIFQYCKIDLSDLRVIGIKANSDTIEAPYFLITHEIKEKEKPIECQIINRTHKNGVFYFTFVIPENNTINQIELQLTNSNYDWRVHLQGSNDQSEWFSICDNYRIVNIQNRYTNYQFNKLFFPEVRYKYLRIRIPTNQKPDIKHALLRHQTIAKGNYIDYATSITSIQNDKKNKQTIINIEIPYPAPVSKLYIKTNYPADFYRPFTIKEITDSIVTATSVSYVWQTLSSGTLSSLETPFFFFPQTVNKNFSIIIENHDNPPLNIDSIVLSGYTQQMIIRFDHKASYFLYFGNTNAPSPKYDIAHFAASAPKNPKDLQLGNTEKMPETAIGQIKPIVTNTLWLWIIIGLIGLLIGYFTIKMIQNHQKNQTND